MKFAQELVITGGLYKGQKITAPGGKTHPMGERERLAIMNSVTPYLEDAEVVDLYAGSGALGIEAISRGAKKVTLVEKDNKAYKTILSNLKKLGIDESKASVILSDAKSADVKGNVIFLDPPYDNMNEFDQEILANFKDADAIVISHPEDYKIDDLDGFNRKDKSYAKCFVTIFTNKNF